jgi:hypothetical protein
MSVLFVKTKPVFETDNISRITFYAYYGGGIGSEVPAEHMTEIVDWLDSFRADHMAFGAIPPGTNTVQVEIEYTDGKIIKQGLDTMPIGWIVYYIRKDEAPACLDEILSQTSLDK